MGGVVNMGGISRALAADTKPIRRAMIWVPAAVSEVREALRRAGHVPAVLVEADSATVVVFGNVHTAQNSALWARACAGAGGVAVVFVWDDRGNSYPAEVAGARAVTLPAQLARAFQTEEDVVRPHLGMDSDHAAALLERLGRPQAAQVARLAGGDAFDELLRARRGTGKNWLWLAAFVVIIGLMMAGVVLKMPMGILLVFVVAVLGAFFLLRRVVAGKAPVDQSLPVIPLDQVKGT